MSHLYTPSPVAITDTTLPDDGDLASAVSVNTPLEDALDGTKYVQDAINGTSTGTMTPADLVVAGGSLNANGTEVTTGVDFIAAAPAQFNSTLTAGGAMTCASTTHHVGAVTCASTLGVTGATTCSGSLTVNGAFVANSPTIDLGNFITDIITCTGEFRTTGITRLGASSADTCTLKASSVLEAVQIQGTGGYRSSLIFDMPNANVAAYALQTSGEKIHIRSGVLGAAREISLVNSSVYLGCTLRIFSQETTHKVTVKDGASTVCEVRKSGSAGQYEWVDLTWTALDSWVVCGGQRL